MSEKYLDWLENLVCSGPMRHKKRHFGLLLEQLYARNYTYIDDLDGARAKWGLTLRDKYLDEVMSQCDSGHEVMSQRDSCCDDNKPCSMLEMMVALAWRMENEEASERWDDEFWDYVSIWFWGMIDNMGLGSNDNVNYDPKKTNICVDRVLGKGYNVDGRGGLFTLKINSQGVDMNKIDIWRQAMLYMAELSHLRGEDHI